MIPPPHSACHLETHLFSSQETECKTNLTGLPTLLTPLGDTCCDSKKISCWCVIAQKWSKKISQEKGRQNGALKSMEDFSNGSLPLSCITIAATRETQEQNNFFGGKTVKVSLSEGGHWFIIKVWVTLQKDLFGFRGLKISFWSPENTTDLQVKHISSPWKNSCFGRQILWYYVMPRSLPSPGSQSISPGVSRGGEQFLFYSVSSDQAQVCFFHQLYLSKNN